VTRKQTMAATAFRKAYDRGKQKIDIKKINDTIN
jgi:hypothetical protein